MHSTPEEEHMYVNCAWVSGGGASQDLAYPSANEQLRPWVEWGACRLSLKIVYCTLIRPSLDYGSIIYRFASESTLKKIETIQNQALRTCCGAFKASPIAAMQVEVGEAPLFLRRYKIRRNYWVNLKGHKESHPVKRVIEECWEHGNKTLFGVTAFLFPGGTLKNATHTSPGNPV